MTFGSFDLDSRLHQAIDASGYVDATAIQTSAIPAILAGGDVLAGAQTGTGKTAAFALPLLQRILLQDSVNQPRILVLTPTRELAQQVYTSFVTYAQYTPIRCVFAYGGCSIKPQISAINEGVDVLVATPGRLLDLLVNGHVSLLSLQSLVLDEADRMLDLGFKNEIDRILKRLPEKYQSLLFSATLNDAIFSLSKTFLHQPTLIEVDKRNTTATTVEQLVYNVDPEKKRGLCSYMIGSKNWQQVLIFTRTKNAADDLAKEMAKDGLSCAAIHGDKSQGARERALQQFKEGGCRVLIATDVAARGLDIKQLQFVINYELPYNAEDYIHRIGRCGRAGDEGLAITLVAEEELYLLHDIEKLLDTVLLQQWFEGFEPDPDRSAKKNKRPEKSVNKKRARQIALGLNASQRKNTKAKRRR